MLTTTFVEDKIRSSLPDERAREDAEIGDAALEILRRDAEVSADAIDVKVLEGWVTLTGAVTYQFESDAAFEDVAALQDVVGVTNDIEVAAPA